MRLWLGPVLMVAVCSATAFAQLKPVQLSSRGSETTADMWDEARLGPLPHGNRAELLPAASGPPAPPFSIRMPTPAIAQAPSGLIASPPEYSPCKGVLFRFSTGAWPDVVRDCVVELTRPGFEEIAYVLVSSTSQQSSAVSVFSSAGADMSKVQFIVKANDSIWARDYGPHFIWQGGALAIADSHYYPQRPNDNFVPTLAGVDYFNLPVYAMDLYYSGGNFQPGPNRSAFVTSLINESNPTFSNDFIGELYQRFQGIDTLHVFTRLPSSVDGTGHIDMWMYLIDEDSVYISQFLPGSNSTAIAITDGAVPYMQSLGFNVVRGPAWNTGSGLNTVHYTYSNAFRVNNRIFIPKYEQANASYAAYDAQALAAWQAGAGPGVQIVPIECDDIIPAAGAIHCIVMQVPRYVDALPSAYLITPQGGELLIGGDTKRIQWNESDDGAIVSTDIYYSLNDGANWQFIATSSGNFHDWIVPMASSNQARLKIVATDNDGNSVEQISPAAFTIRPGTRHVYTFATGAGVDKTARGYQTADWSVVDTTRLPVASLLSSTNYGRIATSNATGGESDTNRYAASTPTTNNRSTHVFEFTLTEGADRIGDIEIDWEGFASSCTNNELYVWDDVQGAWGDAHGLFGENRSLDNYAGTRDAVLSGHIRSDFARYLTAANKLTFLLYADRAQYRTLHDFVSVTVSVPNIAGDMNCDGAFNNFDIDPFVLALTNSAAYAAAYPGCTALNGDANFDGSLNNFDIDPFVACLISGCP